MICRDCKKQMILDHTDFNFKGNMDKYWICEHCKASCIEEIRYGQSFKEYWEVKNKKIPWLFENFTIKHKIDTSIRIKKGNL